MASRSLNLYIGVTSRLRTRIWEHKVGIIPGFTARYRCERLVYYEEFEYVNNAIARERQLKGWLREKKLALIRAQNPTSQDLSQEWFTAEELKIPATRDELLHVYSPDQELQILRRFAPQDDKS